MENCIMPPASAMTAVGFEPAPGCRLGADDISIIGPELVRLTALHGGLAATVLTAEAHRQDSPLHPYYNWNVKAAARAHWDETSRKLIRSIIIKFVRKNEETNEEEQVRTRALHCVVQHLVADDAGEDEPAAKRRVYITLTDVVRNENYFNQVLADCLKSLRAFQQKYRVLSDEIRDVATKKRFRQLWKAIDALLHNEDP